MPSPTHPLDAMRPIDERLAALAELSKDELVDRVDHFMTVTIGLGSQLADIAELVGLDRDAEDLTITPRVRELVSDPRVRQVLDEFAETRRRTLAAQAKLLAGNESAPPTEA
jgi:hypothetical protein